MSIKLLNIDIAALILWTIAVIFLYSLAKKIFKHRKNKSEPEEEYDVLIWLPDESQIHYTKDEIEDVEADDLYIDIHLKNGDEIEYEGVPFMITTTKKK